MKSKREQMAGSPSILTSSSDKENLLKAMANVVYDDRPVTPAHLEAVTTFNPFEIRPTKTIPVSAEEV